MNIIGALTLQNVYKSSEAEVASIAASHYYFAMASFACLKKETRSTVVISTVHSAAAQQVYIFMLIYLFQLKHLHGQSFLSISLLLSTSSQLFLYLIVAQKKCVTLCIYTMYTFYFFCNATFHAFGIHAVFFKFDSSDGSNKRHTKKQYGNPKNG